MSRTTRKVQMEWVAERDAWLAAGGTFETWRRARTERRHAAEKAASEAYAKAEQAAVDRAARGEMRLTDIPYVHMHSIRVGFEHFILTGRFPV